jgi:hypothetical protein
MDICPEPVFSVAVAINQDSKLTPPAVTRSASSFSPSRVLGTLGAKEDHRNVIATMQSCRKRHGAEGKGERRPSDHGPAPRGS